MSASRSTAVEGGTQRDAAPSRPDRLDGLPTVIDGRYELREHVATVRHGSVWLASDLTLRRTVSVTVLRGDPATRSRHTGEIEGLARLAHPGLVTMYDGGTVLDDTGAEHTYLVTERVGGTTLGDVLAQGPLPAAEAALIGADLAETLAHLHSCGVVHGDVSPANVVLIGDTTHGITDHIKLTGVGTAAPADRTGCSPAGDMLGLGGVVRAMLGSGLPAQPTDAPAAVRGRHRTSGTPTGLGPAWTALLGAMTADDPTRRLPAAEAADRLRDLSRTERDRAASGHAPHAGGPVHSELPPFLVSAFDTAPHARVESVPVRQTPAGREAAGTSAVAPLPVRAPVVRRRDAPSTRRQDRRPTLLWLLAGSAVVLVLLSAVALLLNARHDGAPAAPGGPAAGGPPSSEVQRVSPPAGRPRQGGAVRVAVTHSTAPAAPGAATQPVGPSGTGSDPSRTSAEAPGRASGSIPADTTAVAVPAPSSTAVTPSATPSSDAPFAPTDPPTGGVDPPAGGTTTVAPSGGSGPTT